jgi:type II secretory pathway component PulF
MAEENNKKKLFKDLSFGRVSLKDKSLFSRNLSIMLKAGLSLNESLDILSGQTKGNFKKIILEISALIYSGSTFSAGLSAYPKVFSNFYIYTIKAGETSGNLESNLLRLAEQLDKEMEFKRKIREAMFYPCIVLVLSLIIGLVMSFVVLPKITPLFTGLKVDLPASTKMLIWFSSFIKNYGIIFILSLVGFFTLIIWALKLKVLKPYKDYVILHFPLLAALSRNKNMSMFCQTLGSLLANGLNIDEALAITEDTLDNYYYKRVVAKLRIKVSQGTRISDSLALDKQYFSEMLIGLIRVGEKSGNLEDELMNLSQIYEKEIDGAVKLMSSALEPALLIVIGLVVGTLAMSIITPIYKITGSIR